MRVLFLTRYTRRGPSSRYRTFQHLPHLERHGLRCEVSPFFDDGYLEGRFSGGRRAPWHFLRGLLRRLAALATCRRNDVVVVEKELIPFGPTFLERILLRIPRVCTLDFDDALFHVYDSHPRRWVRHFLGQKLFRTPGVVKLVTAANPYLSERFDGRAPRVESLPTVLDVGRYTVQPPPSGPFTIGWIGTPISAANLEVVAAPLAEFFGRHPGRLLLVGAGSVPGLAGVPVETVPWSEETEAKLLESMHVGIMPLRDRPLERGKSGLKLLQYLASGRPVVASPVGVNKELATSDVGFLASNAVEWTRALEELYGDPEQRERMGRAGRAKVEQQYALEPWSERYAGLLREVAGQPTSGSPGVKAS